MKHKKSYRYLVILVFLIAISIVIRFKSYLFSSVPLWYDHGMYRAFFSIIQNNLPYINFEQLPVWIKSTYEPFSGLFYITFQSILWVSVDGFLLRWVWFIHIIISVFIYLLLKKYSKTAAIIGILLYLSSIAQYQVFRRWYLKQMIWIIFILTAYYLIEKKSYRLLIPILAWLFTVNRAGGLFFLFSFVVYKFIIYKKTKSISLKYIWPIIIAWLLSLLIYRPVLREQVLSMFWPMFGQIFIREKSGTFFDKSWYIWYNIILIFLSIFWCIVWWKKHFSKDIPMELVWFEVGILRWWLQLFFYNRMLGYLDIFVIILAAYGLSYFILSKNKIWKSIGIWLYVLQLFFFVWYVNRFSFPLMIPKEFKSIRQIPDSIKPYSKIMVTGRKYSAFLMWYASHNIIAPWLFDLNKWDENQRTLWHKWDGDTKCKLLNALNKIDRPDYLWIWSLQPFEQLSWNKCFKKILWDDTYWFYQITYPDA